MIVVLFTLSLPVPLSHFAPFMCLVISWLFFPLDKLIAALIDAYFGFACERNCTDRSTLDMFMGAIGLTLENLRV